MMKKILPFTRRSLGVGGLALLFCAAPLAAQTEWIQNTTVRKQNSNKEPVPNAHVVFDGAPTKFSGQDGKVRLAFPNKKPGAYTFLVELTKEGYELVNNKDFENIKLSADDQLGVDLILAKTGVVDAAKKEYYDISDRSLKAGFEREKAKIRRERDEAKITAQHFEEQWKQLQEQYDNQKKELDVLAEKFARINFDDVDSLYRQALELFKDGKIDTAIEMLENADPFKLIEQIIGQEAKDADDQKKLDARKLATAKTKEKIIAQVRLLADMYGVKFNPAKAEALFDGLVRLDSTDLEILQDAADFYRQHHRYEKALRVLPFIIAHPQVEDWEKADGHGYIALIYTRIGNLHLAIQANLAFQKAYTEMLKANPNNPTHKNKLALSHEILGSKYLLLGRPDTALMFFQHYNKLSKELCATYPQNMDFKSCLAISYSKLGLAYSDLGNLDTALSFFKERTRLSKELNVAYPKNVDFKEGLAISYMTLGITHTSLDMENTALQYFEQFNQLERELCEAFPQNVDFKNGLAMSYQCLGHSYISQGNLNKALKCFLHFNALEKELYEIYPLNVSFKGGVAVSCGLLGWFYWEKKNDKTKARLYYEQCQVLLLEITKDHPDFAEFQSRLNWVQNALKDLDK